MSLSDAARARAATDPIRVVVVGAGLIGRQRATALQELDGATLVATVDPVASAPLESEIPHFRALADVRGEIYDAAVISVPHVAAPALAASVLRAGKPVLIEKPLGITGEEARALERLASEVGRPSFVGYNYRFLPAIGRLVSLTLADEIGPLRNLDLLIGHGGHPGSAEGWKLDPVQAGGGVLLDPGVHLIDLLLALSPDVECSSVVATRGFWGTGVEEDVVATFTAGSLLATVRVSHLRWINTFRVEAFGESGYLVAEGRGGNYGPMTLRQGRRWAWREPGVTSQRESEELAEFGDVDRSLRDELAAVIARWRGAPAGGGFPEPAEMAQGRRVTELCEVLYPSIGGRGAPDLP